MRWSGVDMCKVYNIVVVEQLVTCDMEVFDRTKNNVPPLGCTEAPP